MLRQVKYDQERFQLCRSKFIHVCNYVGILQNIR